MRFITLFWLSSMLTAHPLHVSYTHVEYTSDQKTITVSHKLFKDDFTLLFYHLFEKDIVPQNGTSFRTDEAKLIEIYMKERFGIISETDTIALAYIRKEQDDESLWLYYEGIIPQKEPGSLEIFNQLMLDLYLDQTNLVILVCDGKETGFAFNYENQRNVFDIKE